MASIQVHPAAETFSENCLVVGHSPLSPLPWLSVLGRITGFPLATADGKMCAFQTQKRSALVSFLHVLIIFATFVAVNFMLEIMGVEPSFIPSMLRLKGMSFTDVIASYCGFVPNIVTIGIYNYAYKDSAQSLTNFCSGFSRLKIPLVTYGKCLCLDDLHRTDGHSLHFPCSCSPKGILTAVER